MSVSDPESSNWRPTKADSYRFRQGYVRYAAGLGILNSPKKLEGLHRKDVNKETEREGLVVHAQTLIWAGLSDVIRYANPPKFRSPFTQTETRYKEALPVMVELVDEIVKDAEAQLKVLNPMLIAIRPLPLGRESTYKAVAHGRKAKVSLNMAMDAFTIDSAFGDIGGQTFEAVPKDTISSRDLSYRPFAGGE